MTCQPCIRLAAAKSVLRLSRKWDFHISPRIFRLTISMAKVGQFVCALYSYGSWNHIFHGHPCFASSKFVVRNGNNIHFEKAILLVNLLIHQLRLLSDQMSCTLYFICSSLHSCLLPFYLLNCQVNSFRMTHSRMTLLWLEDCFWIKHTNY